jgi:nucleoside-triphosphatase THEP1
MTDPKRIILTGMREVGKTTLLLHLVEAAKVQKIDIRGVISPAVIANGQKVAIDLYLIHSGQQVRLANLNRQNSKSTIATEYWAFDSDNLALGNKILAESTPCDLLVIDELGPIELERGQGWQDGINAVDSKLYKMAVLVIRPSLVALAQAKWPDTELISLDQKSTEDQNKIVATILSRYYA